MQKKNNYTEQGMKYRCFSSLPFSLCETLSDALGVIQNRTSLPPPPLSEFCIRVLLIISEGNSASPSLEEKIDILGILGFLVVKYTIHYI